MDKFELEVIAALRELEVPAHLKGYEYIKTAMGCIRKDPQIIYHITKELYPAVAKLQITTATRVERGIRHAVKFAFMDLVVLKKVLGTSRALTNSEFLATLNEVIKVKMATDQAMVDVKSK